MRFILENRTVLGQEAVDPGMAGEAVEDDKVQGRLAEYCDTLCQWPLIIFR
jgi:2-(1,2-epoxy-1,2-dihydrophenyl)acetyl-CoA isomerase